MQYVYEIFQNVKLKHIQLKKLNLALNLPLISNNAPNLQSVICSEINILFQLHTKHYFKIKEISISTYFLWKLLSFIGNIFYNLLYEPIRGLP